MRELGPDEGINRLQHPDCRACKEHEALCTGLRIENAQLKKKLAEGGDAVAPAVAARLSDQSTSVAEGGPVLRDRAALADFDGSAYAVVSAGDVQKAIDSEPRFKAMRDVLINYVGPDNWGEGTHEMREANAAIALSKLLPLLSQQSSGGQEGGVEEAVSQFCGSEHHVLCPGCSCPCHGADRGGVE